MELAYIIAIFIGAIVFGLLAVISISLIIKRAENIARKAGLKSTDDFFSEIESKYRSIDAKLLSVKKVHKQYSRPLAAAGYVIDRYQVEISAAYWVSGMRQVCRRSIFSMVPNSDESLADKTVSITERAKSIKVYCNQNDFRDAYIFIDDLKSWDSVTNRTR